MNIYIINHNYRYVSKGKSFFFNFLSQFGPPLAPLILTRFWIGMVGGWGGGEVYRIYLYSVFLFKTIFE